MSLGTRNDKDLISGAIFAAIGLAAVEMARHYPLGTTTRMGPGYFPLLLGAALVLLGALSMARGLRSAERIRVGRLALFPLALLSLGILAFGFAIERLGLLIAIFVLTLLACLGGGRFRPVEALAIFVGLACLASLLFMFGLGLPAQYLLPH